MTTSPNDIVGVDMEKTEVRYAAALVSALLPLAQIADAFDANELDDEARKRCGKNLEHECTTPHEKIELYTGRGGRCLLTLADCMKARDLLRGIR